MYIVSELFKKRLVVDPQGGFHLKGVDGSVHSLASVRCLHKVARASVSVGCTSAAWEIDVFAFVKPRPGKLQMFWSALQLYKALGLKSYSGTPSTCFQHPHSKWQALFVADFGADQLIFSTHGNDNSKSELQPWNRCLPCPSMSTCGLIHILAR